MTGYPQSDNGSSRKKITITTLAEMRARAEKIAMLTCYDASFAATMDESGVDALLVGDSLGMVIQGHGTTLPVTLTDICYHTACVARGNRAPLLIADMPFGFYAMPEPALDNAALLMRAGAEMVKLEGGSWLAPTVKMLVERGIPVCAHLGLTPQSVHQLGGFKVQGKTDAAAIKNGAAALIKGPAKPAFAGAGSPGAAARRKGCARAAKRCAGQKRGSMWRHHEDPRR